MYICKNCGNKIHFIEYNVIATYLTLDETTGKVLNSTDRFINCDEVMCTVCKASSLHNDVEGA